MALTAAEDMRPPTVAEYARQLANGVGSTFNLQQWCTKECNCLTPRQRLDLLFEPVRCSVAKLLVLEELEGTEAFAKRDSEDGQWAYEYGEIQPEEFDLLLARHHEAAHGVFFDLGSGTGKCVMQAALSGRFTKAVGIEVMQCTNGIAEVLLQEFHADILPALAPKHVQVECRHGSLLDDLSWLEADFVFCCNVAFPDEMTEQIASLAERMRPGAVIVTVMVPLPSRQFRVLEEYDTAYNFGEVETLVHQRIEFETECAKCEEACFCALGDPDDSC